MNKIVIGVAAAIIVLGGILLIARPNLQSSNNTASVTAGLPEVIAVEEKIFDFGKISMAKGEVSHSFTIKNTGEDPVIIDKMFTSCMCTTAVLKINGKAFGPYGMQGHGFIPKINQKLGVGEEAIVEATFDPAAHGPAGVGPIQRAIIIENNAGEPIQLIFNANVTP